MSIRNLSSWSGKTSSTVASACGTTEKKSSACGSGDKTSKPASACGSSEK